MYGKTVAKKVFQGRIYAFIKCGAALYRTTGDNIAVLAGYWLSTVLIIRVTDSEDVGDEISMGAAESLREGLLGNVERLR